MLYFFVKAFFKSKRLALLSSFIAAIEPFFIAYSHQARNYSFSFFLTLLATYLFLKIIEKEGKGISHYGLYIAYALLVGTCLLSHFLTFTVFIGHGLYVLLFFRKWQGWARLAISMTIGMSIMALWMIYGAGQWTLENLEDQAQVYRQAALTNPYNNPFGVILPATPKNVLVKAFPMFSDLFLFSNGLYENLAGKKNGVLALLVGLVLIVLYRGKFKKNFLSQWLAASGFGIMIISLFLYSQTPLLFGVMSVAIFLFYLLLELLLEGYYSKPLLWFMVIMAFLPNLFLVVWSFRNGHTYGLTQRYGGFSFPYSIILVSLVLMQLGQIRTKLKYVIFTFLVVQMGYVLVLLGKIYADQSPKYTYFSKARRPNPYYDAAQKIQAMYETGDTVKYPTYKYTFLTEKAKTFLPYSLQDAQLTNLYLPKDASYIQLIDTTEISKIVLVKAKNQQKLIIYDLEGQKHRY
ncbi:MAG: glycosyltransferase family 39 protein [Spirosomataceae bacterium]